MSKRSIKYIVILLLSAGSLIYGLLDRTVTGGTKKSDAPQQRLTRVEHVFDGDTVSLNLGGRTERMRLIGIDAPEMGQKPWGRRAKKHLEGIISASSWSVVVERDIDERDKYGRLLGYLRTSDGRLINELIVREGYAVLYTFPPNVKYVDILRRAEGEARSKGLGVWGKEGLRQDPRDYRRQHPRR